MNTRTPCPTCTSPVHRTGRAADGLTETAPSLTLLRAGDPAVTRGELEGRSFGGIGVILREQFTATVQDEHFANKVPDLVRFSDAFPPAGSGQAMRRERKRVAELEYSPT